MALKQQGPWTYGALANHIWSVAGPDDRQDVNSTFLQPFLAYVTSTHTTFSLNTGSTYNWESEGWSVPINLLVAQMLKIGKLPIQLAVWGSAIGRIHPRVARKTGGHGCRAPFCSPNRGETIASLNNSKNEIRDVNHKGTQMKRSRQPFIFPT